MRLELSLFPEEYPEPEEINIAEVIPEEIEQPEIPSAIGGDFVINKCHCRQLLLVDPAYAHLHLKRDMICEACNPQIAKKYLQFLKMNL